MKDNTQALLNQLIVMNLSDILNEDIVEPPKAVREELFEKVFPPEKVDTFLLNVAEANSQAIVVADCEGIIEWASPAFTRMCGYSLGELRGNKAGKMLQGEGTDPLAVEILRSGIREKRTVETNIVNYHKSGDVYHVEIQLSPTYDPAGGCTGFIALEKEVAA